MIPHHNGKIQQCQIQHAGAITLRRPPDISTASMAQRPIP